MNKITLLPHWCLTGGRQAFYDTESGDAIEQTARVYAAMRDLQSEYNKMVDELNKTITNFIETQTIDRECFEKRITKTIHDYLDYLDTKVKNQDKVVADAVDFMKTNLSESITTLIGEMKESGELDEAVLNAIDGIGSRVLTLETTMNIQETKINSIETKVLSLESNRVEGIYNEEMEEISFINMLGGVN